MRRLRALAAIALLAVAASAAASSHTVSRGETLGGIASRHGVSVSAIAAANGLSNPDRIFAGQQLVIPSSSSDAARPAGTHVVSAGESLARIARRYGTTVSALVAANGIRNPNLVRIGARLTIPSGGTRAGDGPVERVSGVCPVRGAGPWDFVDGYGSPRPGGRVHAGIDVFARRGTPVVAPFAGTVVHATNPLGGLAFELVTPSGARLYGAHLAGLAPAGPVEAGDVIGWVGASGNAAGTPPHLHVEYQPDGVTAINPYSLLRDWCS